MNQRNVIRYLIRKVLSIHKNETIEDGLARKQKQILRKLPHKEYTESQLREDLVDIGIMKGDTVIVHSSWRGMYALSSSPYSFLDILLDAIGDDGTIVLPCYGSKDEIFDPNNTKSSVGILSEILRNRPGSIRSVFPKFSMVAYGKNAGNIIREHEKSKYQFDIYSPYYIATHTYNAKILLVGMGKTTHKISVFHCATYMNKDTIPFYQSCFLKKCTLPIVKDGKRIEFDFIDRTEGVRNNKRAFLKLFKKVPRKNIIHPGYSLVLFNALDAYDIAYDFCSNGGKLYKY